MTEPTTPVVRTAGSIDFWRQLATFNPQLFDTPVTVVGAGAVGSHVVDTLANMGVTDITVYDFDNVENHNLPNQIFALKHIGQPKVEALKSHILEKVGIEIKTKNEKVTTLEDLKGILIMAVDSMEARKKVVSTSARQNKNVPLVIEVRMAVDCGAVYTFDPNHRGHYQEWFRSLCDDKDAVESPCNNRAISTTAKIVSAIASHRIVIFAQKQEEKRKGNGDGKTACLPLYNLTQISSDGAANNFIWGEN